MGLTQTNFPGDYWGPAIFRSSLVWEGGGGLAFRAPTTAFRQLLLFSLDTGHFSDLCGSSVSHNDGCDQGPSRRAPPLQLPPVGAFALSPLLSKKPEPATGDGHGRHEFGGIVAVQ